ncbi:MAG: hypothetical protein ACK5Q5_02785 [Planctomycetaceae bacterium]
MLTAVLLMGASSEPTLLNDSFEAGEPLPRRRAQRGNWKIADGVAKVTQDDEQYKQYKNHGPIIFYDLNYTDATIQFQYQPKQCKSFVLTCNGDQGHVFRFVTTAAGTSLRAFPPGEEQSIQLHRDPQLTLADGKWTQVTVKLRGEQALVQIGDAAPIKVEHASLARPKSNLSVGFAFGTFAVRDVIVTL